VRMNRKMGGLSDFERGQIIGGCLADASVTKLPQFWVHRERQFLRLWKDNISEEEQKAKFDTDRKRSRI
jgi:hypothetical protein